MHILSILFLFFNHQSVMASPYEVDLSKEQWSVRLLLDTCKEELKEAVEVAVEDLDGDFVAVLPDVIGYQYFNVVFKRVDGNLVYSEGQYTVEYQFDYVTEDDLHEVCLAVNPRRFVY